MRHIWDRFCALLWCSVTTLVTKFVRGLEPAEAKKYSEVRTGHQALSANHAGTMLDCVNDLCRPALLLFIVNKYNGQVFAAPQKAAWY